MHLEEEEEEEEENFYWHMFKHNDKLVYYALKRYDPPCLHLSPSSFLSWHLWSS